MSSDSVVAELEATSAPADISFTTGDASLLVGTQDLQQDYRLSKPQGLGRKQFLNSPLISQQQ